MELKEIISQKIEFKLEALPSPIQLRTINLADEVWIEQEMQTSLLGIFQSGNMMSICRVAYNQIVNKIPFIKQKITIVNGDGDEVETTLGGYRLLMAMICGEEEKAMVINALAETIKASRPKADETPAAEEKKSQ